MRTLINIANGKRSTSLRITGAMLAITPLWLLLSAANTSVHAQTSDDVSGTTAAASSPADWTEFHRDNMQRWNPYETVLGVGNVDSLHVKWKNPIGRAPKGDESSPVVANGVVYFGSGDHNVYALNASTGAYLWSYKTGNEVSSAPAVVDGVVYIGSRDGHLYALNAGTGAYLWSYNTGSVSSATVVNGVVYVGSWDNNLYALNASTGARLWSFDTGNHVYSSPAVADGVVYVGSVDNNVYALNASTGAKLWSFDTGDEVFSSPAVANGMVYVGCRNGNVFAVNASTGVRLWSYATGSFVTSSPAVANGVVYVGSEDDNVYALNARTGAKLWHHTTPGFIVYSSPAVANGAVYYTSQDGRIHALNASTGALLWSYAIVPPFRGISSPIIVNGLVYVQGGDEVTGITNLYAFAPGPAVSGSADLFLRIQASTATVHQGDLLTYAFPVWNLGPDNADQEVLNTQVPAGTTFDYIRISGTPGLGTCIHPRYQETGAILCHENGSMAPNTTWTVRVTVKVTAAPGTVITENAATLADSPDPNMANNTATVSLTVQ